MEIAYLPINIPKFNFSSFLLFTKGIQLRLSNLKCEKVGNLNLHTLKTFLTKKYGVKKVYALQMLSLIILKLFCLICFKLLCLNP